MPNRQYARVHCTSLTPISTQGHGAFLWQRCAWRLSICALRLVCNTSRLYPATHRKSAGIGSSSPRNRMRAFTRLAKMDAWTPRCIIFSSHSNYHTMNNTLSHVTTQNFSCVFNLPRLLCLRTKLSIFNFLRSVPQNCLQCQGLCKRATLYFIFFTGCHCCMLHNPQLFRTFRNGQTATSLLLLSLFKPHFEASGGLMLYSCQKQ